MPKFEKYSNSAIHISKNIVKKCSSLSSVAENSINPQNIEADIRKKLLPQMFRECKTIGGGMDQAKKIVEMIVQITRVGLNGL